VQFLGIAIDDGENVRAFAAEGGLNYPTLHGQADAMEVMSAYGNKTGGLPFTVLVDPSGGIVARHPRGPGGTCGHRFTGRIAVGLGRELSD
jgi:hypothetical protein